MKHFALFLLLVPLCLDFAQAQSVGAFHIGLNGFAPEWDPGLHLLHFVEGVATDTTTTDPDTLLNKLTNRQFYRAIELGANLINPNIQPDHLLSQPNVVREICEAAVTGSDTLLAMITDWGGAHGSQRPAHHAASGIVMRFYRAIFDSDHRRLA